MRGRDYKMRVLVLCFGVAAAFQTATWGGDHVRMDVTQGGAELEFDCATGTIAEAVPERDGAFTLKGTFTPQHSGPSRDDNASRAASATYSGTINGDTMTLRLVLAGNDQELAHYVLVRGSAGKLMKCR